MNCRRRLCTVAACIERLMGARDSTLRRQSSHTVRVVTRPVVNFGYLSRFEKFNELLNMLELLTRLLGAVGSAALAVLAWLLSPVPLAITVILAFIGYRRYTRHYDFWRVRGVGGPPARFPWGVGSDIGIPLLTPSIPRDRVIYRHYGGKRYCGLFEFRRPVLFVGDPELLRDVLIKDFASFTDRRAFPGEEVFDGMLVMMRGRQWKETRTVMTPTFSASKLRGMHELTLHSAANLRDFVVAQSQRGDVEIWDACGRFSMDNIAACAFGVDCNSFQDPNSAFATNARDVFSFGLYNIIRVLACMALPFGLGKLLPDPTDKAMRFLSAAVKRTIAEREGQGGTVRDYLQLLMETTDRSGARVLSDDSVVMQSVLFLAAGFDTTSRTLMFALYSLAQHADVQRRVQAEVDDVLARHGGVLTHDAVAELTYLDQVISETLRMYPLVVDLERESTDEWTIPGTEATLPVGTLVNIPVYMIHHDPDYYPNPETFDPDRFLPEMKESRRACTYLPFGAGPRNCIGMRFAMFEMKVALATLLHAVWVQPGVHTPPPPIPLNSREQVLAPAEGKLFITVVPRKTE